MLPSFVGAERGQRSPQHDKPSDMPPLRATRLLDQVRERIRLLHYSSRTEEAYVHWCRAFIRFHDRRHPKTWPDPRLNRS